MKKSLYYFTSAIICLSVQACLSTDETEKSTIAYFTVNIGNTDRFDSVVSLPLDPITRLPDSSLALYEIRGDERILTDVQITATDQRYIHWILKGESRQGIYSRI